MRVDVDDASVIVKKLMETISKYKMKLIVYRLTNKKNTWNVEIVDTLYTVCGIDSTSSSSVYAQYTGTVSNRNLQINIKNRT